MRLPGRPGIPGRAVVVKVRDHRRGRNRAWPPPAVRDRCPANASLCPGRAPRPPRPPGRSRADAMTEVALTLFAERNFASVTIKDIGTALGVNTALIYYYFDSKEDLFRAAIERAVERAFLHFRELRLRHSNPRTSSATGWTTTSTCTTRSRSWSRSASTTRGCRSSCPRSSAPSASSTTRSTTRSAAAFRRASISACSSRSTRGRPRNGSPPGSTA